MFPIHFKLTVGSVAELNALNAFINTTYAANVANAPRIQVDAPTETAAAPVEKPKRTRVEKTDAPAPSSPTAEAVVAAAPEKTVDASPQPAAAVAAEPQASTAAPEAPFEYATLQKLVFKLLPTHGAKLLEVSVKHGAAKFKELPADKWQAAHDDLIATYGA